MRYFADPAAADLRKFRPSRDCPKVAYGLPKIKLCSERTASLPILRAASCGSERRRFQLSDIAEFTDRVDNVDLIVQARFWLDRWSLGAKRWKIVSVQ